MRRSQNMRDLDAAIVANAERHVAKRAAETPEAKKLAEKQRVAAVAKSLNDAIRAGTQPEDADD